MSRESRITHSELDDLNLNKDVQTAEQGRAEAAQSIANIYRAHSAALLRFLAMRTGSVEEARDVAHEAFGKMLALDKPGAISFWEGYLWTTARNIATDRRRQRLTRAQLDSARMDESLAPSPESWCDAIQHLDLVEAAIEELPPKCRKVFELRIFGEHKFEEISRQTKLSLRTVKDYFARAVEHCQYVIDRAGEPR